MTTITSTPVLGAPADLSNVLRSEGKPQGSPVAEESPGAPAPADDTLFKPPVDWWQTDSQRYGSTGELVDSLTVGSPPVNASYYFRESGAKFTLSSKMADVVAKSAVGAALCSAALAGGALVVNVALLLENMLTYYPPALQNLSLGTAGLIGAGIGAAAGLGYALFNKGVHNEAPVPTASISGQVVKSSTPDGDQVNFYPGGNVNQAVNLSDYANAGDPPPAQEVPGQPWYKDVAKGALYGAAGPLSIMVPVIGAFIPTAVTSAMGHDVSGGTTAGSVAGAAVGIATTAGTIAAGVNIGGLPGLAVATGVSSMGGATLGPVIFPKIRQAEAEYARWDGQWWRNSYNN